MKRLTKKNWFYIFGSIAATFALMGILLNVNEITSQDPITATSELFQDMCLGFFDDQEWQALDKDGNDVTNDFYTNYIDEYTSGNIDEIYDAFRKQLSSFKKTTATTSSTRGHIHEKEISSVFYELLESDHLPDKTIELSYEVGGTYIYDETLDEITEANNCFLDVFPISNPEDLFSVKTTRYRRDNYVTNGEAVFLGSFHVSLDHNDTVEDLGVCVGKVTNNDWDHG